MESIGIPYASYAEKTRYALARGFSETELGNWDEVGTASELMTEPNGFSAFPLFYCLKRWGINNSRTCSNDSNHNCTVDVSL